jgi:hypothetical protein
MLNKSYITIPEYLRTRPVSDILDPRKTPYACAYGMEGKTFYETLSANPGHLDAFNRSMSEPGPEYGIFPFSSLKQEVEAEPERTFVVDIGGGKGQALQYIKAETGGAFETSSKLILQDRPDVLEQIGPEQKIGMELMSYDFHTEQPVKGIDTLFYLSIRVGRLLTGFRRTHLLSMPDIAQLSRPHLQRYSEAHLQGHEPKITSPRRRRYPSCADGSRW